MKCPACDNEKSVVKVGIRNTRKGPVQKFRCRSCSSYFSDVKQPYTHYPVHVILHAVELYNTGYPASVVKKEIGRRYPYSPPVRTIYSWIDKYEKVLSFKELRRSFEVDPEGIIGGKVFNHQQVFPFRYHILKLNLSAKRFPGIRRYLNWVMRSLPDRMFLSGPRASTLRTSSNLKTEKSDDPSMELCRLSLLRMANKRSAHDSIESFMLANDDRTVCTELPVFLNPKEAADLRIRTPITGHIDILQVLDGRVRILDYKPNLRDPDRHASQLSIYRRCLTRRTSIPAEDISIAVFNEHEFHEYH